MTNTRELTNNTSEWWLGDRRGGDTLGVTTSTHMGGSCGLCFSAHRSLQINGISMRYWRGGSNVMWLLCFSNISVDECWETRTHNEKVTRATKFDNIAIVECVCVWECCTQVRFYKYMSNVWETTSIDSLRNRSIVTYFVKVLVELLLSGWFEGGTYVPLHFRMNLGLTSI